MALQFALNIDLTQNGSFSEANEQVIRSVNAEAALVCERGKDQITELAPPIAGQLACELYNTDRRFSAENESSPIYGQFDINREVQFSVLVEGGSLELAGGGLLVLEGGGFLALGARQEVVWSGLLARQTQKPRAEERTVGLLCLGNLSKLARQRARVSTAVFQSITTDVAINAVLDEAGWPADKRVIQMGNTMLSWFWADNENALAVLIDLLGAEGPGASLYEDSLGRICFENRHSRFDQQRSTTVQQTFADTNANVQDIRYDPKIEDVINICEMTVVERAAQDESVIWQYEGELSLAPNEMKRLTVRAASGDPFINAVVPSATSGINEVQRLTVSGATGGGFSITYEGEQAEERIKGGVAVGFAADAASVKAALESIPLIGVGGVQTSGGPLSTSPVDIEFTGPLAARNIELLTVTSHLQGTGALIKVEESVKGRAADYLITYGGLAAISLTRVSGGRIELIITAGPDGVTLNGLQVRAQIVSATARHEITSNLDTSASIEKYDARRHTLRARAEIDKDFALDLCNTVVYFRQNPTPVVEVDFYSYTQADAATALTREISDRTHIVESHTGIDDDYFVERIRNEIVDGLHLKTTFGCEKALPASLFSNFAFVGTAIADTSIVALP